jgi:hypothetical protein
MHEGAETPEDDPEGRTPRLARERQTGAAEVFSQDREVEDEREGKGVEIQFGIL